MDSDFEAFATARWSGLLRTAYFLVGDRHEAEDMVQSALLRTGQHWRRARQSPEAYVRRALVNLAHDRRRRFRRRPREISTDKLTVELSPAPDAAERLGLHDLLLRGLMELPPRQRQVVVLRYLEDLSLQETSAVLGCGEGTVKAQASKGLRRLRELLAEDSDQMATTTSTARTGLGGL